MQNRILYLGLLPVSIVVSLLGIWYAVCRSLSAADAGRGGACAVMLSFAALFIRDSYGKRVYKAMTVDLQTLSAEIASLRVPMSPATQSPTSVNRRLASLETMLDSESSAQLWQNVALALSSIIGTAAWGFGDLLAKHLNAAVH